MRMPYIPNGMIEKEYRWELVNYNLYNHLHNINPYNELDKPILKLIKIQKEQINNLYYISLYYKKILKIPPMKIEFYNDFKKLIEELHYREYQLLQEYLSYETYFLSYCLAYDPNLNKLIHNQTEQVNILTQIKDILNKSHLKSTHLDHNQKGKTEYILEKGYRLEKVVGNLTFPTDLTFDDKGNIYIAESGFAYGTKPNEGIILCLNNEGFLTVFIDGLKSPVTSIVYHKGYIYVGEGGRGGKAPGCGEISKISINGKKQVIVSNLPSCGDHFTGDITFGKDGKMYFSVGTATNSGVIGVDNVPWVKFHPNFHDRPARNVILNGTNFISSNPFVADKMEITGPYKSFGQSCYDGEKIQGSLKANGVIYSCNPDGSNLRIIGDGFRNPFGLGFSPYTGRLYASDNGADPRGSRPIQHDWDNLWEISPCGWHGWPDFYSGLPVTLPHFHVEDDIKPTFVMKNHPILASQPITRFEKHTSSDKFDFSTNPSFGYLGQMFLAQLGDMEWGHHKKNYGFKVVRVNIETGQIRDFLVNTHGEKSIKGPIRPVTAVFNPNGSELYVVDFGVLGSPQEGKKPKPKTGAIWKIVRA